MELFGRNNVRNVFKGKLQYDFENVGNFQFVVSQFERRREREHTKVFNLTFSHRKEHPTRLGNGPCTLLL